MTSNGGPTGAMGGPGQNWHPKPGDRVVRHPRAGQITPLRLTVAEPRSPSQTLVSPLVLSYVFLGLVGVSTLLLLLPFMHSGPGSAALMDALFTAVSAITLTGLPIQDTASYWTPTGQVFILGMIFVGGLMFMIFVAFLSIASGQRLTLPRRILDRGSLQIDHLAGLTRLAARLSAVAVGIQFVGFLALLVRFLVILPPSEAVFQAAFHSVSSFNNAGFVVVPEASSLSAYRSDVAVLGVSALLIFLGAISYWVIIDVASQRSFSRLMLNSKLVIISTIALIVGGATAFLISEYGNQATIGGLHIGERILVSLFESTSGRTAGFSTVSWGAGAVEQHTKYVFAGLMIVGGASGSVAGGMKVNALAIGTVAVLSTLRGYREATAFGRYIGQEQVQRAMTIGATAIVMVLLVALSLILTEGDATFIDILFESVSALGTAGLSSGLTGTLSSWGNLILVAAMFIGRVGPFTLDIFMFRRGERSLYRYAQERVTIG